MRYALLLIAFLPFASKAQVTYNIYTYGTNKTITIKSSTGQVSVRPTNSIFLQYTKDSTRVQIVSIYNREQTIMNAPDSIIHFYSGSFHFTTKFSLDSFFKAALTR